MRLLILALLVVGCDKDGGENTEFTGDPPVVEQPDLATPPDMAEKPYPAGPYGNKTGQTIANIMASGYRLSTTQTDSSQLPWETISLKDYYVSPDCNCLLITIGARWCTACIDEQPALVQWVQDDKTFCVLGVLQDGTQPGLDATRADVDKWTKAFQQNFPVVLGTPTTNKLMSGHAGPDGTIGLPFSLIVKTSTMKVVGATQGFGYGVYDEAVSACAN